MPSTTPCGRRRPGAHGRRVVSSGARRSVRHALDRSRHRPGRCASTTVSRRSAFDVRLRDPGRCHRRRRRWLRARNLRLRRRRLLLRPARGKEAQRIDVPVRFGGEPDPEIDVGLGPLGIAARPDRPHDVPFRYLSPGRDSDRPEMDERDRVPVRSPNREAEPLVRELTHERDDARGSRPNVRPARRADVDAAMLAPRVRIAVGHERP
jgi:hypothetical protein